MSGVLSSSSEMLVSVIVNNYNYGRYLPQAIDSALAQRYQPLEVIVVDDGSADDSPAIIASYGEAVTAVYQENGGQAAAFNAGFGRSSGQVVIFLDADDVLLPDTATRVVETFRLHDSLARVQYRLAIIDEDGRPTGETKPPPALPLAAGDLRAQILRTPDDLRWQPSSGNAFAAWVLREIFPMPVAPYRISADYYLSNLTPLFGRVVSLDIVGGLYRIHGRNHEAARGADPIRIQQIIRRTAVTHDHIRTVAARLGLLDADEELGEFLSVTFLANRLISLKLSPQHHPLPGDSIGSVVRQGIAAALNRQDASLLLRTAYVLWFLLVAAAPRPLARMLAGRFLYTDSPRRIDSLFPSLWGATDGRNPGRSGA